MVVVVVVMEVVVVTLLVFPDLHLRTQMLQEVTFHLKSHNKILT
jgi:hypothetical protein